MLSKEQIDKIISSVIPELKKKAFANSGLWKYMEDRGMRFKTKKDKPEFYAEYNENVKTADRIRVHAELDAFPSELFVKRAPNMTPEEYGYVEANFKSDTTDVFLEYTNTVKRAFSDDNWSIKYQEDDETYKEESLQEYLEHGIDGVDSLENYIKDVLTPTKAIDAAGLMAVTSSTDYEQETDGDGNPVYDEIGNPVLIASNELPKPQPVYHPSQNIIKFSEDEWYFVLSDEKTLVKNGDKDSYSGYKFILYDKDAIWHVNQYGEFSDFKFQIVEYFRHEWNRVPVTRLKGIPKICKGRLTWIAPFAYVTNTLDIVLLDEMYLFCSKAKCAFPFLVTIGHVCEFQDTNGNKCTDGFIFNQKANNGLGMHIKCSNCGGAGEVSRISPLGQLNIRPADGSLQGGDGIKPSEAMAFIAPPTSILEFLRKEVDYNLQKGRAILHLFTSNTLIKGQENMTATGMGIDLKAMYAFIKPISDQTFSIFEFLIDAIGFFRYRDAYKKPILTYPSTFDFNTEGDYLFRIGEAKKAGLPPAIIHEIIKKYLYAIYFNEEITAKLFKIVLDADRLLVLSDSEVEVKLSKGTAEKWESILHDSIFVFLEQLQREEKTFLKMDLGKQITLVQNKAKEVAKNMQIDNATLAGELVKNIVGDTGGA